VCGIGLAFSKNVSNLLVAMPEISSQTFGATLETSFKKAVALKDARIPDVAQKCLEVFASYGLSPTQIALRHGDSLYNYELSFSLFNGNAIFKISAEKLHLAFANARGEKDGETVADCVAKIHEQVALPEMSRTIITANAQVTLPSIEDTQKYLLRYANPAKGIVSGGTIAFVQSETWPEPIRLSVEQSLVYPNGLFLYWQTGFAGGKMSREILVNLGKGVTESVTKIDLVFAKSA
jgi:hypothetical protein